MGKEFEKEVIPVYVKLNHFAVCLKWAQYCLLSILQYKMNYFKCARKLMDLLK